MYCIHLHFAAHCLISTLLSHYSSDEESNQVFIPFISDVRVRSDGGAATGGPQSFDWDDSLRILSSNITTSGNPVVSSPNVTSTAGSISSAVGDSRDFKILDIQDKSKDRLTPPSSPHVGSVSHPFSGTNISSVASPPISLSKERYIFTYRM